MQTLTKKSDVSNLAKHPLSNTAIKADGSKKEISDRSPKLTIDAMDGFFNNMRLHRISMTSCHAIIKLYIASLTSKGPVNLSSLANQLGVTTAATTSIADTIEKLGFARRFADPGDRRSIMISLTARGTHFAESFGASAKSCS